MRSCGRNIFSALDMYGPFAESPFSRMCHLLEQWVCDYPSDFAVPGTAGALSAVVKQILKQPHTLNYGSEFLPFLEMLPTLVDQDAAWALPPPDAVLPSPSESEESDSYVEEGVRGVGGEDTEGDSPTSISSLPPDTVKGVRPGVVGTRNRKTSSLTTKVSSLASSGRNHQPLSSKEILAKLVKVSQNVLHFSSEVIAEEITMKELELYIQFEVRLSFLGKW